MTTTTGPRPLTDTETEAWTLHLQKVPVAEIQTRTGLLPSQIAAAVDLGQVHARRAMKSSTAVLLEAPSAPAPAAPVQAPAAAPKPLAITDGRMPIGQLLAWAEKSGHNRAVTLAARTRTAIEELRAFHSKHDARAKAQAEVERLTAELEAAKAALKAVGTSSTKPPAQAPRPSAGSTLSRTAAIREWAQQNGFACSTFGKIPKGIEAAYDNAHRSAA